MKAEGSIYLVLHLILSREDTDVQLYPMMLSLKQLKPQSLLPMIQNRPASKFSPPVHRPGKRRQTIYQAHIGFKEIVFHLAIDARGIVYKQQIKCESK